MLLGQWNDIDVVIDIDHMVTMTMEVDRQQSGGNEGEQGEWRVSLD